MPIIFGFKILNQEQVKMLVQEADGCVSGKAIMNQIVGTGGGYSEGG